MDSVKINGRTYPVPELTFNAVVDLSAAGIDISQLKDLQKKPFIMVRAIASWIMGVDPEAAGAVIQEYVVGGGDMASLFGDLFEAFTEAIDKSGFLHAFQTPEEAPRKLPQDHKKKA